MVKIMIVDDHEIMRRGLSMVFESEEEFDLVGEACDGEEACEKAQELRPDVILMDIRMPKKNGIMAAKEIKQRRPSTKIIILTAVDDEDDIFNALNAGINGYVLKDIGSEGLMEAVRSVESGISYLQPQVARRIAERLSRKPALGRKEDHELTECETIVLGLMARGFRNKDMAEKLFVTEETIKTHVSHVLEKLGQKDRMHAVLFAIRHNLVKVEQFKE